jgi:hypothetical protein
MGNICELFCFGKEYTNTNTNININKNTKSNNIPFLDISNNYCIDNEIEPPSYSEICNVKNREYNNFIIQYEEDYKQNLKKRKQENPEEQEYKSKYSSYKKHIMLHFNNDVL